MTRKDVLYFQEKYGKGYPLNFETHWEPLKRFVRSAQKPKTEKEEGNESKTDL